MFYIHSDLLSSFLFLGIHKNLKGFRKTNKHQLKTGFLIKFYKNYLFIFTPNNNLLTINVHIVCNFCKYNLKVSSGKYCKVRVDGPNVVAILTVYKSNPNKREMQGRHNLTKFVNLFERL